MDLKRIKSDRSLILRLTLVLLLAALWLLSYPTITQKLPQRAALLHPPRTGLGWARGSMIFSRTSAISQRDNLSVHWRQLGFGYNRDDFDRAEVGHDGRVVAWATWKTHTIRIPFWFLLLLASVLLLMRSLKLYFKRERPAPL